MEWTGTKAEKEDMAKTKRQEVVVGMERTGPWGGEPGGANCKSFRNLNL